MGTVEPRKNLDTLLDACCRAHRNRRADHEKLIVMAELGQAQSGLFDGWGSVFGDEDHLGAIHRPLQISGVAQTSGAHVAAHHVFQVLLKVGDFFSRQRTHPLRIFIKAGDRQAKVSETGREHGSEISRTVHRDLHMVSSKVCRALADPRGRMNRKLLSFMSESSGEQGL